MLMFLINQDDLEAAEKILSLSEKPRSAMGLITSFNSPKLLFLPFVPMSPTSSLLLSSSPFSSSLFFLDWSAPLSDSLPEADSLPDFLLELDDFLDPLELEPELESDPEPDPEPESLLKKRDNWLDGNAQDEPPTKQGLKHPSHYKILSEYPVN